MREVEFDSSVPDSPAGEAPWSEGELELGVEYRRLHELLDWPIAVEPEIDLYGFDPDSAA